MEENEIKDLSKLAKGMLVIVKTSVMRGHKNETYLDPAFFVVKSCTKMTKSELTEKYSASEERLVFKQNNYDYHRIELIQFTVSLPNTISIVAKTEKSQMNSGFKDIAKEDADSFELFKSSLEDLKLHLAQQEGIALKKLLDETSKESLKIQQEYTEIIGKVMTWTIEK